MVGGTEHLSVYNEKKKVSKTRLHSLSVTPITGDVWSNGKELTIKFIRWCVRGLHTFFQFSTIFFCN